MIVDVNVCRNDDETKANSTRKPRSDAFNGPSKLSFHSSIIQLWFLRAIAKDFLHGIGVTF